MRRAKRRVSEGRMNGLMGRKNGRREELVCASGGSQPAAARESGRAPFLHAARKRCPAGLREAPRRRKESPHRGSGRRCEGGAKTEGDPCCSPKAGVPMDELSTRYGRTLAAEGCRGSAAYDRVMDAARVHGPHCGGRSCESEDTVVRPTAKLAQTHRQRRTSAKSTEATALCAGKDSGQGTAGSRRRQRCARSPSRRHLGLAERLSVS